MEEYEIRCKGCGKRLLKYSKTSARKYKSPVKSCSKCGMRYADPRCHEIAIEGIPSDTFRISSYIFLAVAGALILYRGIYLFGMHQMGTPETMQWLLPTLFTVIGCIMLLGGLTECILIVTGIKRRRFDKLTKESEQRLADKGYVYLLQELGYQIPGKILVKVGHMYEG